MASLSATGPRSRDGSEDDLTLHEMFKLVGDQMTERDVSVLKSLFYESLSEKQRLEINDGFTFLLALEAIKNIDECNLGAVVNVLRIITRHDLTDFVTLQRIRRARPSDLEDPVDRYLEKYHKGHMIVPFSKRTGRSTEDSLIQPQGSCSSDSLKDIPNASVNVDKKQKDSLNQPQATDEVEQNGNANSSPMTKRLKKTDDDVESEIKKKESCDITLHVRAEYCDNTDVLQETVFSNKPTLIERQFERFRQANTILKSRELGSMSSVLKFSELTYLDAFWRDYVNGSLVEALKDVFITDSLRQAVDHEELKLVVRVNEDEYFAGRLKLMKNLI